MSRSSPGRWMPSRGRMAPMLKENQWPALHRPADTPRGLNRYEPCPGRHVEHARADWRRKVLEERHGERMSSGCCIPRIALNALRPLGTPPVAGQRRLTISLVHLGTIADGIPETGLMVGSRRGQASLLKIQCSANAMTRALKVARGSPNRVHLHAIRRPACCAFAFVIRRGGAPLTPARHPQSNRCGDPRDWNLERLLHVTSFRTYVAICGE